MPEREKRRWRLRTGTLFRLLLSTLLLRCLLDFALLVHLEVALLWLNVIEVKLHQSFLELALGTLDLLESEPVQIEDENVV